MSLLCSQVASKCVLSIRGVSGFIVPRWTMMDEKGDKHPEGTSTDADTNRALHMNARTGLPFWRWMTWFYIKMVMPSPAVMPLSLVNPPMPSTTPIITLLTYPEKPHNSDNLVTLLP